MNKICNLQILRLPAIKIFLVVAFGLLTSACSEDKKEEAFRASLIEKALNDDNRKLGDKFLLENKQRENVITTASGLQYEIIEAGTGEKPNVLDTVVVHYEGFLVNNEMFDSSYKRNKPSEFPLTKVVKGWRQALLNMKVGSHWKIYLPPNLAYGATSPSDEIAANSSLIFNIKLLKINKVK